jgi:hypothetical protein
VSRPPRTARPARRESAFPKCVVEAYNACPRNAPKGSDTSGVCLAIGPTSVATTGPLWKHRSVLAFLAGKDPRHDDAHRVWTALRGVTNNIEVAAAAVLLDVLQYAPNSPAGYYGLTRNELRDRDKAVLNATNALLRTLGEHQELLPMPSTRFWPARATKKLRERLYGLPVGSLSGFRRFGEPMPAEGSPDALAWRVENDAPTVVQILVGLHDAAEVLRASRGQAPKISQRGRHRLKRGLLQGLLSRHPDAPLEQIAAIAAPIVETFSGADEREAMLRMAYRMRGAKCPLKPAGKRSHA